MTNQHEELTTQAGRLTDYQKSLTAALPAKAARWLSGLDDSARQRVCTRATAVIARYERLFSNLGLLLIIFETAAKEFAHVPDDADFEVGLNHAETFAVTALPIPMGREFDDWTRRNAELRKKLLAERADLQAARNSSNHASAAPAETSTLQPAEDGASCLARFDAVIASRKTAGVSSRHKDVAHELGWDGTKAQDRISHTRAFWRTGNTKPTGPGDPAVIMGWVKMQESKYSSGS